MNIHKWAVSHQSILNNTQVVTYTPEKCFSEPSEDHGTTLGLVWHSDDSLSFQIPQQTITTFTKRSVLSLNNSIFDPHGLLLPYRMLGRMLFNAVCAEKPPLAWDQWKRLLPGGSIMWQGVKIFMLNNLLVMTGRADQTPRPLMHPDSNLAKLWVLYMHEQELQHCGGHRTLASACRQVVWLWQGSSLFRKISRNCVRCRRVLPRPRAQQMAPLPPARYALQPMAVFTEISLDYAGPWFTKQGRGKVRQPRYLLLLCCMASRACALEFTYSETTDSTFMALQRFASRYRLPKAVYSDNGPSLVAAANILNTWSGEQGNLPIHPGWKDIHWTFSHPRAPHSNGVTESLIKSAKHSIKKVLLDEVATDDILRTVFAYVEDILNQRPIALVNNDPHDLETLTPALLLGRTKGNIAPGPDTNSKLLRSWKIANTMAQKFWSQF